MNFNSSYLLSIILYFSLLSISSANEKDTSFKIDIVGYVNEVKRVSVKSNMLIVDLLKKSKIIKPWGSISAIYVMTISHPSSVDSPANISSKTKLLYYNEKTTVANLKLKNGDVIYVPARRFTGR